MGRRLRVLGVVAALLAMGAAASAQDVKSDQQVLIELEQLWDAASRCPVARTLTGSIALQRGTEPDVQVGGAA